MLEIEIEQKKKFKASLQEVMANLKVGCVSSTSDQVDSEHKIIEEGVKWKIFVALTLPAMKLQIKDNLYKFISIIIYCRRMLTLLQARLNLNYW